MAVSAVLRLRSVYNTIFHHPFHLHEARPLDQHCGFSVHLFIQRSQQVFHALKVARTRTEFLTLIRG